jgi:hypothetical protein
MRGRLRLNGQKVEAGDERTAVPMKLEDRKPWMRETAGGGVKGKVSLLKISSP